MTRSRFDFSTTLLFTLFHYTLTDLQYWYHFFSISPMIKTVFIFTYPAPKVRRAQMRRLTAEGRLCEAAPKPERRGFCLKLSTMWIFQPM